MILTSPPVPVLCCATASSADERGGLFETHNGRPSKVTHVWSSRYRRRVSCETGLVLRRQWPDTNMRLCDPRSTGARGE